MSCPMAWLHMKIVTGLPQWLIRFPLLHCSCLNAKYTELLSKSSQRHLTKRLFLKHLPLVGIIEPLTFFSKIDRIVYLYVSDEL